MRIFIVGCGKIGQTLAQQLVAESHDVTIIATDERVLANINNTLDVICYAGNGASYLTLRDAGAQDADLVIAVTESDEVNMLCALTAKRLGAEHAIIAYRRTEDEMPCRRAELHHAKAEGGKVLPLVSPLEFVAGEDGSVCAVKVQKMKLGEPDESGRRRPVPIEGAIEEIPCDVAISAIGTNANPFAAKIGGKMELNKWGYIVADEETGQTTDPRIWAGGDIVTGAATVILAMGAGKKAAASITKSLLGE